MEGAGVPELRCYPLRSEGSEEPPFPAPGDEKAVAETPLDAPWPCGAPEVERSRRVDRTVRGPVREVEPRQGRVLVARCSRGRRRKSGVEPLDHRREVGGWRAEEARSRVVACLPLPGGTVAELAREGGAWSSAGTSG